MEATAYPVSVSAELDEPLNRWLFLIKWLLLIPHFIILALLWIVAFLFGLASLFAILFTGKYPRGLFDFNVGVLRWTWRVGFYGYEALGTDKYPPFGFKSGNYPADLAVEYPERLHRGLVLIKWILAIPHLVIVSIFSGSEKGGLINLLAFIAAIANLFTGKYPADLFKLVVGMNRWSLRVIAYALLMTDKYPPFRLEE